MYKMKERIKKKYQLDLKFKKKTHTQCYRPPARVNNKKNYESSKKIKVTLI